MSWKNVYCHAAIEALAPRLERFPEEKETILSALTTFFQSEQDDMQLKKLARRVLKRAGAQPQRIPFSFKRFATILLVWIGSWYGLNVLTSLGVCAGIVSHPGISFNDVSWHLNSYSGLAIDVKTTHSNHYVRGWDFLFGNLTVLIAAIGLALDAKRVGARRVIGYLRWDNLGPWGFADAAWGVFIAFPMYLLKRERIRRNAVPIPWEELQRTRRRQARATLGNSERKRFQPQRGCVGGRRSRRNPAGVGICGGAAFPG